LSQAFNQIEMPAVGCVTTLSVTTSFVWHGKSLIHWDICDDFEAYFHVLIVNELLPSQNGSTKWIYQKMFIPNSPKIYGGVNILNLSLLKKHEEKKKKPHYIFLNPLVC